MEVIGRGAFEECIALTYVKIPASVNTIEKYAFFTCTSLTEVDFLTEISELGKDAFKDTALKTVNAPETSPIYDYAA